MDLLTFGGFLLAGILAGFLAGLLGIGGGLIVVPLLYFVFSADAATASHAMHLALGSSLAFIVLNSGSAAVAHVRLGAVRWVEVRWLAPGLLAGSLGGAWLADQVSTDGLRIWFGSFLLAMAVYLFLQRLPEVEKAWPRAISLVVGLPIGGLASLAGVGGGVMVVPWLMARGIQPAKSVATSSVCTVLVASLGAFGYMLFAPDLSQAWTTGYVFWPAVLTIAATSMLMAPVGARAAHRINQQKLKKGFAGILAIVGLRLLLD
ncbi:MAG: sulfite exporter TauE/SafE family protein [Gammaproteobacteria bacterium]|nr:sulfite exporter TauE/SafE family protein [Gammaproteobacteria bacterium]